HKNAAKIRSGMPQQSKASGSFGKSLVIAVVATAAATVVRAAFDPFLGPLAAFVTYFLAVVAVAWEEGWQAGLLATAFGAVAGDYFFLAPRFELGVQTRDALFQTILFVLVSGSIVVFSHLRLLQNARISRLLCEVRTREQELRVEIE